MKAGSNFILLLQNTHSSVAEFCNTFHLASSNVPKPMSQPDIFALSPYIHPKSFDLLLAQQRGNPIYFFKQLMLPTTRPPQFKSCLVYCPVRGVISQHESFNDARTACSDYLNKLSVLRQKLEARCYEWRENQWSNGLA